MARVDLTRNRTRALWLAGCVGSAALVVVACSSSTLGCASDTSSASGPPGAGVEPQPGDAGSGAETSAGGGVADGAPGDAGAPIDASGPASDAGEAPVPTDCTTTQCHYVRSGANGAKDGSDWDNAYPSLPSKLERGHTYFVATGTYDGYTFNTPASGTTAIVIKKALVGDHGTSKGWSDAFGAGTAVFNGTLDFTTSYWTVDGQTGGGAANGWIRNFGFSIVQTANDTPLIRVGWSGKAEYVTVAHVDMQGTGGPTTQGGSYSNDGVATYGTSNLTISHFHMKGIGRCPFFAGGIHDGIVEHGWVESYFGTSQAHSEIASIFAYNQNVGDLTFRYNLFTDIQSTGGLMWDNSSNPAAHMYVYGNTFYKPQGITWGVANGLVGGWTGANHEEFHNAYVYNNTFVNADQETLSTFPNIFSGNVAYNNLFYNCDSPDFAKFPDHDFNEFIQAGDSHSEAHGTSSASGDPFVDMAGLDFRLKAASPAAKALPAPFDKDPLGATRGANGKWAVGAFEAAGP